MSISSKVSSVFIVLLLITAIFTTYTPLAYSASTYSEELSVDIIGSSIFWMIKMKGGNITLAGINGIESVASDVSSYSLSFLDSSNWSPEFELFSNSGYNLIGFDSTPSSGIFLKVNAANSDSAKKLANSLDDLLYLSFSSYSSSPGLYTFYSHMDLELVKDLLWDSVPYQYDGLARILGKDTFFANRGVPVFKFSGERIGDGFVHTVSIGGLNTNVVSADNQFPIARLFNTINTTKTSPVTSESSIIVRTYGGLENYVSLGTSNISRSTISITNFPENTSSRSRVVVPKGYFFPDMSVEVSQSFPSLIAMRSFDRGTLNQGDVVTIGVKVRNVAPVGSLSVENITVSDDWWKESKKFELVDGQFSRSIGHLGPGGEFTLAYKLKLLTSDKSEVTAPATSIFYTYKADQSEIKKSTRFNQQKLILNDISAVLSIDASIKESYTSIMGITPVNITVRNIGNGHATNLYLDGNLRQSLLSGDIWRLQLNLTSASLKETYVNKTWSVTWGEAGRKESAISNNVMLQYALIGNTIPYFFIDRSVVSSANSGNNIVNSTLTIFNIGSITLDKISLKEKMPNNIVFLNGNYSLKNTDLSAQIIDLKPGDVKTIEYTATISNPDENYLFEPTEISVEQGQSTITRLSQSKLLPLGVKVSKNYAPNAHFAGANITVEAKVENKDANPIFNVDFGRGSDSFLRMLEGKSTYSADTLGAGEKLGSSNRANLLKPGAFSSSEAIVNFTLSGHRESKSSGSYPVTIFIPLSVKLKINPVVPLENEVFNVVITVENNSPVDVKDVNVKINLPREMQVKIGSLQISSKDIDANMSETREATILVPGPAFLTIASPTLQYVYEGDTLRTISTPVDVTIADNVTTRYLVPLLISAIIILIVSFVARRSIVSKS